MDSPLPDREAAGALGYARRRAEQTLLYQLVEEHYPEFVALCEAQGRLMPASRTAAYSAPGLPSA